MTIATPPRMPSGRLRDGRRTAPARNEPCCQPPIANSTGNNAPQSCAATLWPEGGGGACSGRAAVHHDKPTRNSRASTFSTVSRFCTRLPTCRPITFVAVKSSIAAAAMPTCASGERLCSPEHNTSRLRTRISATTPSAPDWITSQLAHPYRKAGQRPNAAWMYLKMPPCPGTSVLSSANTSAPSTASTPPMAHATITRSALSTRCATLAGVKKMPTPMMPPITTQPTSKGPRLGAGSELAGARVTAAADVAVSSLIGPTLARDAIPAPARSGSRAGNRPSFATGRVGFATPPPEAPRNANPAPRDPDVDRRPGCPGPVRKRFLLRHRLRLRGPDPRDRPPGPAADRHHVHDHLHGAELPFDAHDPTAPGDRVRAGRHGDPCEHPAAATHGLHRVGRAGSDRRDDADADGAVRDQRRRRPAQQSRPDRYHRLRAVVRDRRAVRHHPAVHVRRAADFERRAAGHRHLTARSLRGRELAAYHAEHRPSVLARQTEGESRPQARRSRARGASEQYAPSGEPAPVHGVEAAGSRALPVLAWIRKRPCFGRPASIDVAGIGDKGVGAHLEQPVTHQVLDALRRGARGVSPDGRQPTRLLDLPRFRGPAPTVKLRRLLITPRP